MRRRRVVALISPEGERKEEVVRKPVTVARRVGVVSEESSERLSGVVRVTWPKRRPENVEVEVVERWWRREERVGPEMAIFWSGGGVSMAADGEERERK